MAYVSQIPKEEENKFAPNFQTTPNPVPPQMSGSAGEGGGGRGAPGVGTSTQFGSNAAKLSDYLNANKDQAAGFGQQVAGDLTNRYNQTVGSIDQGVGSFGQQVNQGFSVPNQQKVDQAATNPADFAKDPENVKQFQSWYNDQYSGPQNFEGSNIYGDINGQVNKAVENSSLVGSQAGLGTYLNNFMGANDNTEGMRTLDTALLMGNKDSQQAIKSAAAPYQNLSSYLGDKTQVANQGVQSAKQQADQARSQVQDRFNGQNGAIPTLQNDLNGRLAAARTDETNQANSAKNDLLSYLQGSGQKLTPQDLSTLGTTQADLDNLVNNQGFLSKDFAGNFDMAPYLNSPQNANTALNTANFASADDYSKAAALSQLTGQDLTGFLDPANASLAGTAPTSLYGSDTIKNASNDLASQLNTNDRGMLDKYKTMPAILPNNVSPILLDVFSRNQNKLSPSQIDWYRNQLKNNRSGGSMKAS